MTPITTAMPSTVAKPEISISHRTLATIFACAGSSGVSSSEFGLLMSDEELDEEAHAETAVPPDAEAGERLARLLARHIPSLSRSRLKALILADQVSIGGGKIRDPGHRVNAADTITVTIPPPEPAAPLPEGIPPHLLPQDHAVVGVGKPSGP